MAWTRAKWKAVVLDFLERAGWSAGQVLFATLTAGGAAAAVAGGPWRYAAVLAGSAAVSSVVLTAVQYLTRATNLSFWPDTLVRLVKTFAASLAGSVTAVAVFDVTKFDWSTALKVAALATLTALGKGLLARGPSTIAAAVDSARASSPAANAGPATRAATVPTSRKPADAGGNPSTLPSPTYLDAIRR